MALKTASNQNKYENIEMLLLSATYDGFRKKAVLKFYEPKNKEIYLWHDKSDHKPYCLIGRDGIDSNFLDELKTKNNLPGKILKIEKITKIDLLQDKKIELWKVIADNPLVIGGIDNSLRNLIKTWEADIKYYENYMYDNGLIPGIFYKIINNKIIPVEFNLSEQAQTILKQELNDNETELNEKIINWAKLLDQPLPEIKRVSLDIEVFSNEINKFPGADEAEYPIRSIAFVGSDNLKEVIIRKEKEHPIGKNTLEKDVRIKFVNEEKELLENTFEILRKYPCVITYNGDDFDLKYLHNRANKIGINKSNIPIQMGRIEANLKHGIHIDLYRTFINKSIQIYAFGNKYKEHTLNAVSSALIGKSKIEFEGSISELSDYELAKYNYNDALITYELTSFNDDLLMKLLLVISRIAKMPINDVSRLGVSNWIRSMLYFEHRTANALIPRKDDLKFEEEVISSATIKGKKYQGGMVFEPKSGIHFNVTVLDFASLYPSIIKVHNLSYETVRCNHKEDKQNIIKGTNHWLCKQRKGIASTLIGSLRDIRIKYYKQLPKMKGLSKNEQELYSVVSQALKVILNASYGALGAEMFPLYYLPVADATTAIGRNIIKETIEEAQRNDIEVIYGDTDSLFIKSIDNNKIEIMRNWANKKLEMELDLDKTYRYVAFSTLKKNYFGVMKDGTVDIKGFTGKKSHIPLFIKDAFYSAINELSLVETSKDFENAKNNIRIDIKKRNRLLKNEEIPLEKLAFNIMLSKPINMYTGIVPQHVRAAKLLNEDKKKGDIITFVKTIGGEGVKPLQLAKKQDIDKRKYEDLMQSTFDQLLDSLGYSFDEILGATKLEDLFWPKK